MTQKKLSFTKEQLSKAFDQWTRDYLMNPEGFQEFEIEEVGEAQADTLIEYLRKQS